MRKPPSSRSRASPRECADRRIDLGRRGEQAAADHLRGKGYEILARNFRTRAGELDIVALDGETVVFVEVKLRQGGFDPLDAVDARKQYRLSRMALEYLWRHGATGAASRFDVVAVDGRTLECTHVDDAFECCLEY